MAAAHDLGHRVAPLSRSCTIAAWHSRPPPTLSAPARVEVRNRFKGLELIDRVPDELWNEVHDIVQETDIKTIRMEKKWKKAKWLSGEALKIAVKVREEKAKEKRKDIST